ncbi:DUF2934 domain-containing protein [Stakelama saccharophila]|uniref:DUF2934 domain-containing protein n=1 Tax=Stakelama saccharophila TaxID=3075605 RepID=UPI003D77A81E
MKDDTEQHIRDRAYQIWQEEGQPEGREHEHWARARTEIEDARPGAAKSGERRQRASSTRKTATKRAPAKRAGGRKRTTKA